MNTICHIPVLLKESMDSLYIEDNQTYVDATFGAGSFSRHILENTNSNVIAFDLDPHVKLFADNLSNIYGKRFRFINENFSKIQLYIDTNIHGIIFDLGISSMHVDNGDRGFSFNKLGPLDMRMNTNQANTALDFIKKSSKEKIINVISQYGEESEAKSIGSAIHQNKQHINTTIDLSDIILKTKKYKNKRIHPATLTFQAIRIYVNDELKNLENGIYAASKAISLGGSISIISFHALESRVIKMTFKELLKTKMFRLNLQKSTKPSFNEVKNNPRSRSAILRSIARI